MFSWIWPDNNISKETYSVLSLPGSQYIDNDPIVSYDYIHEFSVYSMHIAFDKILISGSYELISIDQLDTGENIRCITGDFDWVYSIQMIYGVTPLLATAHRDCYIRLWDYFDIELEVPKIILAGHAHAVVSIGVFQGANPIIISASFDTTISVWDVNAKIRTNILKNPKKAIRTLSILEHLNVKDSYIICGDDSGTVYVWSRAFIFLRKFPIIGTNQSDHELSPIKSLTSSYWDDIPRAYVGYDDGYIRSFNIKTGEQLICYQGHEQAVRSMVIVEIIEPPQIILKQSMDFSVPLSMDISSHPSTLHNNESQTSSTIDNTNSSTSLSLNSSQSTETIRLKSTRVPIIITAGYDGFIRAWDTESGELIRTFTSHEGEIFALTVTLRTIKPVLISGGVDRTIKCWRLPLSLFLSTTSNESTGEMILSEKTDSFYEQKELDDEVEQEILEKYIEKVEKKQKNQVDYIEEDEEDDETYV